MRYKDKWDSIIEELRSKLNAKISPSKIQAGVFLEFPIGAPYVLVYMEPIQSANALEGKVKPRYEKAQIIIACGVAVSGEKHKAVSESIELAHLALEALESLPGINQKSAIQADGIYNNVAVAIFEATANYETLKLADIQ